MSDPSAIDDKAAMDTHVPEPVTLLIVEDDTVDLMGIKRALKDLRITNPVRHARDGVEALEILRELRDDAKFRSAIVFVLTTSETDDDIISAYSFNVAGYIVKSDLKDGFREAISLLDLYWTIVALPPS